MSIKSEILIIPIRNFHRFFFTKSSYFQWLCIRKFDISFPNPTARVLYNQSTSPHDIFLIFFLPCISSWSWGQAFHNHNFQLEDSLTTFAVSILLRTVFVAPVDAAAGSWRVISLGLPVLLLVNAVHSGMFHLLFSSSRRGNRCCPLWTALNHKWTENLIMWDSHVDNQMACHDPSTSFFFNFLGEWAMVYQ